MTDIASGWTETAPIVVREGSLVVETLERIRAGLPFALHALRVLVQAQPVGANIHVVYKYV